MLSMIVVGVSSTDIYVPAMPQMVTNLHTSSAMVGLTITTYLIGMAFGVLFWGVISDNYGRKSVLTFTLTAYLLSCLLIAFSINIWMILVLRFFQGIIVASFPVVCRLLLNDFLTGTKLFHAINLVNLNLVLSPALAPLVGAWICERFDWRACFLFNTICSLILLIFHIRFIKEAKKDLSKKLPSFNVWFSDYFKVLKHFQYSVNNIMIMANYAIYYAFITVSSFIYITQFNFSPTVYAIILLAASATYYIGSLFAKYIKTHKKHIKYLESMLWADLITLAGACLLILSWITNIQILQIILISVSFGFTRFGFGLMYTSGQVRAIDFFPEQKGYALGACFFLMFLAGSLGAGWASSFHKDHLFGLTFVITTLSLVLMISHFIARKCKTG